jgi:hypothetical protein
MLSSLENLLHGKGDLAKEEFTALSAQEIFK